MNNKTNQGILPFQMVKLGSDYVAIEMAKRQALRNPNVAFIGDQVFANGTLSPLKQPASTKQTNPAPQKPTGGATKPKKRGFLSTLLSSAGKAIKSPAVDAALVGGSGGTAVLYNLLGDDNNSQEASEAPKAQAKAEPKTEAPKAEPKAEAPKAEPTPVTTAPSTGSDPTSKPSTTTPANGTGGDGGRTTTITTVTNDNRDFIDQGLQAINDFKAKHPELFWSGVGLAGLGSIYALTKALDDDDDDEDYYYYRHR